MNKRRLIIIFNEKIRFFIIILTFFILDLMYITVFRYINEIFRNSGEEYHRLDFIITQNKNSSNRFTFYYSYTYLFSVIFNVEKQTKNI